MTDLRPWRHGNWIGPPSPSRFKAWRWHLARAFRDRHTDPSIRLRARRLVLDQVHSLWHALINCDPVETRLLLLDHEFRRAEAKREASLLCPHGKVAGVEPLP
jgi:hypothetical protein